ncbi:imidazole glycerol phosphate synthase subunit HisH [Sphingomonas nostoxanthinifaciens]|uniref:imidazole glycerol phosphate synthase subunit HisH n=1 Tax=Sphingomonas nostoxanthinifaciens TaxID=2872652 RepID=UPI001CC1CBCB|nr:imidazole glycerol phosphate synthase subunit HisH [Sphingomonas nostoxanthinifaciens]UAK24071.1 imidazole glycerol phosphate synthase subunit HisH [Sphingomonas nostoxanthinifaciens]
MTLALIDYGAGNLRSVENALRAAGASDIVVTAEAETVAAADRVVLPGVGAFAASMQALAAIPGMVDALNRTVREQGRPFLGICVGMQLMADAGEEFGRHPGLGWIPGTVARLEPSDPTARVPHMGWNDVTPVRPHPLIPAGEAYFLHSFAFVADDATDLAATTQHGGQVTAAVARDNLVGVQFHPEKSQAYGLALLANFLDWKP